MIEPVSSREYLAREYERQGPEFANIVAYLRSGEPPITHHVYVVALAAIDAAIASTREECARAFETMRASGLDDDIIALAIRSLGSTDG